MQKYYKIKQLLSNINIRDYFGLHKNLSDHYSVSFNINIEKYLCKQNQIILISIMLIYNFLI